MPRFDIRSFIFSLIWPSLTVPLSVFQPGVEGELPYVTTDYSFDLTGAGKLRVFKGLTRPSQMGAQWHFLHRTALYPSWPVSHTRVIIGLSMYRTEVVCCFVRERSVRRNGQFHRLRDPAVRICLMGPWRGHTVDIGSTLCTIVSSLMSFHCFSCHSKSANDLKKPARY